MYKILAEQPILVSVLLGLLAFAALYTWLRGDRQRWLAYTGLVLLLLVPVAWVLASVLETDEERIRATIGGIAAEVEANNFDAVYQAIHPDRSDILARARAELPRYHFARARVGGYQQIRLVPDTSPQEAVVDLIASATVSVKGQGIREMKVPRRLLLHMVETPAGWKVIDYAQRDPVGRPDPYSSGGGDWEQLLHPGAP